jgi:hypothetical protein
MKTRRVLPRSLSAQVLSELQSTNYHWEEVTMARCETCGNEYDKAFQVFKGGTTHTFDSFECAIESLAPTCAHCGCRIIGHGVEANGSILLRPLCQ